MSRRGKGEGTIHKRKSDGRWVAQISVHDVAGRRTRKAFYGTTRAEVARKLNDALKQHHNGLPLPDERYTLKQLLEQWLRDEITPSNRAASTKADYDYIVHRYVIPNLGTAPITKLRATDIQSFLNTLRRRGLGERSVQYTHTVLRMALGYAERYELIVRNPAALVRTQRPQKDASKVFGFTQQQAIALLEAARGDRLEAFYTVAVALGLRRGEALGLRWIDIDANAQTLRVEQQVQRVRGDGLVVKATPKTKSSRRTLLLPQVCVEALRTHRIHQLEERLAAGEYWQDHGLIFTTTIGTPIDPRNINRDFHRICAKAGLPPSRLHNLRHTAATLLLAQGVELKVIQEILGHSSIQVTADVYAHLIPALHRNAADSVDRLLATQLSAV